VIAAHRRTKLVIRQHHACADLRPELRHRQDLQVRFAAVTGGKGARYHFRPGRRRLAERAALDRVGGPLPRDRFAAGDIPRCRLNSRALERAATSRRVLVRVGSANPEKNPLQPREAGEWTAEGKSHRMSDRHIPVAQRRRPELLAGRKAMGKVILHP